VTTGTGKGLTGCGAPGVSQFLRRAVIKPLGYSDDALARACRSEAPGPALPGGAAIVLQADEGCDVDLLVPRCLLPA
jgi:hypothetical protein